MKQYGYKSLIGITLLICIILFLVPNTSTFAEVPSELKSGFYVNDGGEYTFIDIYTFLNHKLQSFYLVNKAGLDGVVFMNQDNTGATLRNIKNNEKYKPVIELELGQEYNNFNPIIIVGDVITQEKGPNGSKEVKLTIDLNKTDMDIKTGYKASNFEATITGLSRDLTYDFGDKDGYFSDFREEDGIYKILLTAINFNHSARFNLIDIAVNNSLISNGFEVFLPGVLAEISNIEGYNINYIPTAIEGNISPDEGAVINHGRIRIRTSRNKSLDENGNWTDEDKWLPVTLNTDTFSYILSKDQIENIEGLLTQRGSLYLSLDFKAVYEEYEVVSNLKNVNIDIAPPEVNAAEYDRDANKITVYFSEDINTNKLFSEEDDFSNISGAYWGDATIGMMNPSSWREYDNGIIIRLADNTILTDHLGFEVGSLVDRFGNTNESKIVITIDGYSGGKE